MHKYRFPLICAIHSTHNTNSCAQVFSPPLYQFISKKLISNLNENFKSAFNNSFSNYLRSSSLCKTKILLSFFSQKNFSTNTTSDESEINRFTELSSLFWDQNGPFNLLHKYNPVRINFIKDAIYLGTNQSYTSDTIFTKEDPTFQQHINSTLKENYNQINSNIKQNNSQILVNLQKKRHSAGFLTNENCLEGLRVLDVGCGGGILAESLWRLGAEVFGIDATEEMIKVAQNHWEKEKGFHISKRDVSTLQYRAISLEDVINNNEKFDLVISSEVIEHVENPKIFFYQLTKALNINGKLIITTINRTIDSYLLAIVTAQEILKIVPKDIHTWDKFVKPEELKQFAQETKLETLKLQGVIYIPFLKKFLLEPFARVMYMMSFEKIA